MVLPACLSEFSGETLLLELLISDDHDLVAENDVRVSMDGDGESQARLYRQ